MFGAWDYLPDDARIVIGLCIVAALAVAVLLRKFDSSSC